MKVINNLKKRWQQYSTHNIFNFLRLTVFLCMILTPMSLVVGIIYNSFVFYILCIVFLITGIYTYQQLVKLDRKIMIELSKTLRFEFRHLDK